MTQVIDRETAIQLLERVVAERGADFTYEPMYVQGGGSAACLYVRDGAPSCGIGLALSYLGLTPEQLSELDAINNTGGETDIHQLGVQRKLADFGIRLEEDALYVLSGFQQKQDRSAEYGVALQAAKEARPW
jgi:hypothetical protein